jgi:glycosyltransferase involved in cell wall biosynthesis
MHELVDIGKHPKLKWSIIMSSCNGQDTLPLTLEALEHLEAPKGDVEYIFINNASSDNTEDILLGFVRNHSAIYIEELRKGKSFALNAGITAASGDIFLLIDDDVVVSSGWLKAYESALENYSDAGILAGQIRPYWLEQPPEWLKTLAAKGSALGCTVPDARTEGYPARQVKGANVAIKRIAIGERRFDTGEVNFGSDAIAMGGEDTKLISTLEQAGTKIVHVPEAVVRHIINSHEMTLRSVLRRSVRIGRGSAAVATRGILPVIAALSKLILLSIGMLLMLAVQRRTMAVLAGIGIARNVGKLEYYLQKSKRN